MKLFSEWVLEIENGIIGENNDVDIHADIIDDLLIKTSEEPVAAIVHSTYQDFLHNINDPSFF